MKQNKKRKKALIKRRIRRIAYTTLAAIMLPCVALVSYILLIDRGILKIHPVNRIEVASEPNTGYVYQQVVIPNINVDTDESKPESSKEETLEPDAVYVCHGTVTGTIDNIDSEPKSQNASESNTNGNVVASEESPTSITPEIIQLNTIGEVDEKFIKQAKEELKLIPIVLKKSFVSEGWILNLTTENLREKYGLGEGPMVIGYTDYNKHEMNLVNTWSGVIVTPSHEMGHYLDYINGFPSESEEFKQIFLEEGPVFKANTLNTEWISDATEFFAEEFAYYVVAPSKCTPKAYQYIESQLKILEERSL